MATHRGYSQVPASLWPHLAAIYKASVDEETGKGILPTALKKKEKTVVRQLKPEKALRQGEDGLKEAIFNHPYADSVRRLAETPGQYARREADKTVGYGQLRKELEPGTGVYERNKDKLAILKEDSAALAGKLKNTALQEVKRTAEAQRIREELSPYLDSPFLKGVSLSDLDSLNAEELKELRDRVYKNVEEHYVQKMLERDEWKAFQREQAELEALKNLPEAYRRQFEAYKNGEQLRNEALVLAAKEAQKLLTAHLPQINRAQQHLAGLKKKYLAVPDAADLSTAVKRNSLKGRPLRERLVLGGNFQIITAEPVVIDLSPLLGYRFNKDFHLAAGVTYRARFSSADSTFIRTNFGRDELTYGYRAFVNYRFWKAFYLHAEYERMNLSFRQPGTDIYIRAWQPGALAGVGVNYTVSEKIAGRASLLYNFAHDRNRRVYPSPWVFRFGIELK